MARKDKEKTPIDVLDRLDDGISLAEKQHQILQEMLKEDIKENTKRDKAGKLVKDASIEQKNRRAELRALHTLPVMAESISKNLGAEKGTKRILEDRLAEMAFANKDIRDSLKHGDSDMVQKKMVELLTTQLEKMDGMSKQEKEQQRALIKELETNFKGAFDWDKIGARADNIFFPLTQKFWEAADGMRSAAQQIPIVGRMFTEGMMEHYRQGIAEAHQILGTHMQTILAPIDALVAPIKGVFKTMWSIGKTLLSKPSKYEIETAKYTRLTYQATKKKNKKEKDEKSRSIFRKGKDGFGKMIDMVKKGFMMLVPVISSVVSFFTTVILPFLPVIGLAVAAGLSFAKAISNLMGDWQEITQLFNQGSIGQAIKLIVADVFDGLFMIPEWLVNTLLSYFTEFRVDFGKDAIMKLMDDTLKFVYDNFVGPVWDFFDGVMGFFDKLGAIFTKASEYVSGVVSSITDKFKGSFGADFDPDSYSESTAPTAPITPTPKDPNGPGYKFKFPTDWGTGVVDQALMQDIVNAKMAGFDDKQFYDDLIETRDMFGKVPVQKPPQLSVVDRAKAGQTAEQTQATKDVSDKLDQTNNNITEGTRVNQQVVANTVNNQTVEVKEIPTTTENFAIWQKNGSF